MKMFANVFLAAAVSVTMALADPFNPSEFTNRMAVVFSGYTGGETLANFPALVRLGADATRAMLEDGADLRFADSAGNSLPYEIDTWDTNGVSAVWVRVPTLTRDTIIYAYWGVEGGSAGTPSPHLPSDVWDDYIGVWHFGEAEGDLKNSTTNNLDAVRVNTVAADGVATGAQFYDGGGHVSVPHDDVMNFDGGAFVVSGWFKFPEAIKPSLARRMFGKKSQWDGGEGWEVDLKDDAGPPFNRIRIRGGNANLNEIAMPNGWAFDGPREWYYVSAQVDEYAVASVHINGIYAGQNNLAIVNNSTADFAIGAYAPGSNKWEGFIDEVRLAAGARSEAWLGADYATMADPNFAVNGAIMDNATAESAVITLGAVEITHESAVIPGYAFALADETQEVRLYWGGADGVWEPEFVPATLDSVGAFAVPLENLAHDTDYWARFALVDAGNGDALVWSAASVKFTTAPLPLPIIGGVEFVFEPENHTVAVDVAQLGINTKVVFSWDAIAHGAGVWPNSVTNPATLGADNVIAIPDLAHGDTRHWRVELISDSGEDSAEGEFIVSYSYVWNGGGEGNRRWNDPDNWTPRGVPNAPGDSVTFETDAFTPGWFVELETPVTIGSLTVTPYNQYANITGGEGVTLTFDNGEKPEPCQILTLGYNWNAMNIQVPVVFAGETRVATYTTELFRPPLRMSGDLTGPGPLIIENGRIALNPPADTTQVCDVPFGTTKYDDNFLLKRGAGDTVIIGTTNTLSVGAYEASSWGAFISEGGRLILDGCIITNTHPHMGGVIFNWSGPSALILKNKAVFHYTTRKDDRALHFVGENVDGNVFVINDSFAHMPLIALNSAYNLIEVENGGTLQFMRDYPWRAITLNGNRNILRVGSADPVRPSAVDLNDQPMQIGAKVYDWVDRFVCDNTVTVGTGGVLRNGQIQIAIIDFNDNCIITNNSLEITGGGFVSSSGNAQIGRIVNAERAYNHCNDNFALVKSDCETTSIWNLNRGNIHVGWQNATASATNETVRNSLRLGFGGIVTNVVSVMFGNEHAYDNRLSLEGGALWCDALTFDAYNTLAPVLSPDGIIPARVSGTAKFVNGAKVVPSVIDQTYGRFALVTAKNIDLDGIADPNDLLRDTPENYTWKLRVIPDTGDETETLFITCGRTTTMLIIR